MENRGFLVALPRPRCQNHRQGFPRLVHLSFTITAVQMLPTGRQTRGRSPSPAPGPPATLGAADVYITYN